VTELAEVRTAERAKDPSQVPYFDLTVSAVKSVSVLHASYRVSARLTRQRGDQDPAATLDARADELEAALRSTVRSDDVVKLRRRCGGSGHYARLPSKAIACRPRGTVHGTTCRIIPVQRVPSVR
jgi:hypothetical protein